MDSTAFLVIALIAIAAQTYLIFLFLFEPGLRYEVVTTRVPLDSAEFLCTLEAITDARLHCRNQVEVLTNGEVYYEAELAAIRAARRSVNLEAYIFQRGEVTRRFLEALTECAKAGIRVNLVLDAVGCFITWNSYFKELRAAGGRVEWYHPFRWDTLARINNRTHRELIIIDGEIGFIGGAGFADHWLRGDSKNPRWRDTMFRIEGSIVTSLQATFVENWLEASGEILTGEDYFPLCEVESGRGIEKRSAELIVNSSPSTGLSTRARILFQTLLASAQDSIHITTPYFLPDKSARDELIRALRERDVKVKIITPGKHSDHFLTRRSSRRLYGELLKAGAQICEYQPAMIHAKVMVIDGLWSVVGSTNFDSRSFGLNDEVNLAACDPELATRLNRDFAHDLAESRDVSYKEWRQRSIFERLQEWLGWVLERQQ
jgi:cardiolipin synthase A/B